MPSEVLPFGPEDKNTTIWSPGSHPIPSSCANVYSSLFVEGYFYKVCPTGFSSNQLYLSFPAGFVNSTISQDDATRAAQELLALKGAELAEASGTCTLGEFQEVFSLVDSTYNWDWVADRADIFPREIKNTLPDGFAYGTGMDGGIKVEFPIGNSLAWPLMIGFFYSETTLFLDETANMVSPTEALRIDIHDDYGLIHLDFRTLHHELYPDLVVYAGKNSNESADIPEADEYVFQNTCLYLGKLVADFGSREIYGPAWDEETDGPSDEPSFTGIVNEDQIREFTVAELGGFLFRIDTASRSIINGKLAGVYLVCYKNDIQVYKYDVGTDEYESLYSIPYDPQNKTTYFGCSIIFDGTNKVAEIYIDGQFELSIPDDTLTNIHLPMCYQRGVFSMDHWVGDIVSGVTYPGTNRLPPPITTRYFEPTDMLNPEEFSPSEPTKRILYPATIVGADTMLEANRPYPNLAAGEVGTGFSKDLMDANELVGSWWGGAFFGQAINILANFDTDQYPELGKVLWGSYALQVAKIEMNRYSDVVGIPSNPYKFLMTSYQIYPIIEKEEIPGIDWSDYNLFDFYWEAYNQPVRWTCSWDGVFQPSDLFLEGSDPEPAEGGNATNLRDLTEAEIPVYQAGGYEQFAEQTGDGWLYSTSMLTLTPGRVFSSISNGEYKDILTKEDVNNHYYFFSEGWFDTQVITDLFSGIRTIKLMTGVQGKRTSEPLEPPEYDFYYRCPLPPVFPDPIDIRIPCLRQEYEIVGVFGPIEGGTHYPLVIEDYHDCLFGDPYDDVCYPSRRSWSAGFSFIPSLDVVFNAGQGLFVSFNPATPELVHGGARILEKLHTEFVRLDFTVRKEGWPDIIYRGEVFINLRDMFNDPPASDIGFSTVQEACYFVPAGAVARYEEDLFGDSPMIALVEVGVRYKFVFTA